MFCVFTPRVGLQVGLDASQVRALGAFLAHDPDANAALELQDAENPNPNARVRVAWNATAARLTLDNPDGAVTLMPLDAKRLAACLNTGSPGPLKSRSTN